MEKKGIINTHHEGFALLGEANEDQLRNFINYYAGTVNISIRPIMEAYKFLDLPTPEEDPGTKWLQTRYYIAYWDFLKADLDKVKEMWQAYEHLRQKNPEDYPKKNADAFFG